MSRRLNTIIIVPHSKAKFIKFSFTTRAVALAAGGLAVALTLSLIAVVYTGSAVKRRTEVTRLEHENTQLSEVNRQLESTLAEVQGRLDEFEERTSRLALAAGMQGNPAWPRRKERRQQRVGGGGPYDRLPDAPEMLRQQGDSIEDQLDMVARARRDGSVLASPRRWRRRPVFSPTDTVVETTPSPAAAPSTVAWTSRPAVALPSCSADGVVVFTGRNGGLGKTVHVSHGFGFTTMYGHLNGITPNLSDIHRGEVIGTVGNTGRSTGRTCTTRSTTTASPSTRSTTSSIDSRFHSIRKTPLARSTCERRFRMRLGVKIGRIRRLN